MANSSNKKDIKPAEPLSLEMQQEADSPLKSKYFDKLRTNAFINHNPEADYVEFWTAMQTDAENDKWQVMQYTIYDIEKENGFVDSKIILGNTTFREAVNQLAANEFARDIIRSHSTLDIAEKYPVEKFPFMKDYFFDFDHYKQAAYIEGLIFDKANRPFRRKEGVVVSEGAFSIAEVNNSILAVEQGANANEKFRAQMEGGILKDIYNTAASPKATFDNILKVGEALEVMDTFAAQVGGLYLGVQKILGVNDGFSKVGDLMTENERDAAFENAKKHMSEAKGIKKLTAETIPALRETLQKATGLGIHTEPFDKFTAESELYLNLLHASLKLGKLEDSFKQANDSHASTIVEIRSAVSKAEERFKELGGTQEQMDVLKAWVADKKKDRIPASLPGFITRYYKSRANVMKRITERSVEKAVKILPVDVKPPSGMGN